jgi:phosphoglycerate dehydrogenase-like enzyme
VVNSARAASIDNVALVAAATAGRLFAALDVYEVEPQVLPTDWAECDHLLLTPHVAGDTVQGRQALTRYVLNDVLAWLANGTRGASFVDPSLSSIAA